MTEFADFVTRLSDSIPGNVAYAAPNGVNTTMYMSSSAFYLLAAVSREQNPNFDTEADQLIEDMRRNFVGIRTTPAQVVARPLSDIQRQANKGLSALGMLSELINEFAISGSSHPHPGLLEFLTPATAEEAAVLTRAYLLPPVGTGVVPSWTMATYRDYARMVHKVLDKIAPFRSSPAVQEVIEALPGMQRVSTAAPFWIAAFGQLPIPKPADIRKYNPAPTSSTTVNVVLDEFGINNLTEETLNDLAYCASLGKAVTPWRRILKKVHPGLSDIDAAIIKEAYRHTEAPLKTVIDAVG